jgi:hypothetical protein
MPWPSRSPDLECCISIRLLRVGLHEIQSVLELKARHMRAADAKTK